MQSYASVILSLLRDCFVGCDCVINRYCSLQFGQGRSTAKIPTSSESAPFGRKFPTGKTSHFSSDAESEYGGHLGDSTGQLYSDPEFGCNTLRKNQPKATRMFNAAMTQSSYAELDMKMKRNGPKQLAPVDDRNSHSNRNNQNGFQRNPGEDIIK
ncbi:hypothetical protein Ciccas_011820 [Cichlidogyrus casuarinus]|uniref:Uncharacterized protein n=1 Tax=Cichlidogyrus casuarinus TaxID=1844966 RepID=A0ABD2PQ57_9PLAT